MEIEKIDKDSPEIITVTLPSFNAEGSKRSVVLPVNQDQSLQTMAHTQGLKNVIILKNRKPKWHPETSQYVLDFNGRVIRESVKNSQLIIANDDMQQDKVVFLLGKVNDEEFNLDFSWPISPVQAFSIALTSFDK